MLRVLAAASLLLCACGGSGSTPAAPAPTPVSTPATTHAAGGLVGTIDLARVRAVCENTRQADTLLQTGLGTSQVDDFLTASAGLLERPPVDPAAQTLGRTVRADVARHRRAQAVAALNAFCRSHE